MIKKLNLYILLFFSSSVFGQIQIDDNNATSSLLKAYFSPMGDVIGAGLNNGWFNTAKPHKLGGFDLTMNFNIVNVPSSLLSFNPNDLEGYTSSSNQTPSILGEGTGAEIGYNFLNTDSLKFKMPNQEFQLQNLPIPTLNLGIGLIKETELNIRYIPNVNYKIDIIEEGEINLIGLGFKHNLIQWIPLASKFPVDLSIQAAFTNLNMKFKLKNDIISQTVELNTLASNYNLIFSKKFLMFTPYISVGYNNASTTLSNNTSISFGDGIQAVDLDKIQSELNLSKLNNFNNIVGIRIQLAVLSLHISQSLSDYKTTSIGAGISFR
jgi:hypothetical protein